MNNTEKLLKEILSKINNLESEIKHIKTQQKENSRILKSVEHANDTHKAGIDNLLHKVSNIEGEVKALKKSIDYLKFKQTETDEQLFYL